MNDQPSLNPQDVWIVQPGDDVALIHKEPMSDLEREIAKAVLEERWPDVHCVLFEGDWDIKIMRSDNTCPDCDGGGAGEEQTPWKTNPCERCDGTGIIDPSEDARGFSENGSRTTSVSTAGRSLEGHR